MEEGCMNSSRIEIVNRKLKIVNNHYGSKF